MDILELVPHVVEKPWGGRALAERWGKALPPSRSVGETWEVSDLAGRASRVASGPRAGDSLHDLVEIETEALLGEASAAPALPVLVKLLHARRVLSLQVHPGRGWLEEAGIDEAPKHEAWQVLEVAPGGRIALGFAGSPSLDRVRELVRDPHALEESLRWIEPAPGETWVIPPGTVHAVGAGVLLYEIQVPADTTLRISDWGRGRETHLEEAFGTMDPAAPAGRVEPVIRSVPGGRRELLVRQGPFRLERWEVEGGEEVPLPEEAVVSALTCVAGEGRVTSTAGRSIELAPGTSVLVPASAGEVRLAGKGLAVLRGRGE